jgi:hypothetical protein
MAHLRGLEHGLSECITTAGLWLHVLGFASFVEAILAFEGMMNFSRNAARGSAASREAAYSLEAALSGNTGFNPLTWLDMAVERRVCY